MCILTSSFDFTAPSEHSKISFNVILLGAANSCKYKLEKSVINICIDYILDFFFQCSLKNVPVIEYEKHVPDDCAKMNFEVNQKRNIESVAYIFEVNGTNQLLSSVSKLKR